MVNGDEAMAKGLQTYLVIEAPFLLKNAQTDVSTGKKNPSWDNRIVLKSFISDVKYLAGRYVRAELWSVHDAVVARAAIPLEGYITEEALETGKPQRFSADLLYGGCKNGVLMGVISFEKASLRSKTKSILSTNIQNFIIPDYKP